MEQVSIIKIGGNIIDDAGRLDLFLEQFHRVDGFKILIHGGGKIASEIGKRQGVEPCYVAGRRITDARTLELVTMVYGGLVNKNIVCKLQNAGTNAIGLSGADGKLLTAVRRPVHTIDYGYVGDLSTGGINSALLTALLNSGLTPVLAPLTYEPQGGLLNTNADTIANEIAKALSATMLVRLVFCFEQKGVLSNPADPGTIIPVLTEKDFEQLSATAVVSGGMLPKLENAFRAVAHGVQHVIIGQAEELPALLAGTKGTIIK
jgi:acetylglutamate kinase